MLSSNGYTQERGLSPSTISNHASSLIYPLKYLYRNLAPNFAAVPLIAQLRRMATILQKKGDLERPKTREDLKALNKWLDWDEVLEAAALQRSRFEVAREKRHRAREAADLLLLSLYCHIPPSRGLEMRTLEVVHEADLEETFSPKDFPNRNIALLQKNGDVVIHVQLFKTFRFAGRDSITLQVDSELCRLFKQYVKDFRSELLCSGEASHHLFVNSNGLPYSSGAFSRHIKNLMARLTGRQVSINTLRSSFLTWAYSRSDCDDTLKDSLAAALRHSREQAQNTYDRRTANEKKAAALDLARRKAEEGPDRQAVGASDQPSEPDVGVGQFVGLVGEESTLQKPCIFLGRVQALLPDGQVCLLWYKNVGGGVYSLEVDGSQWLESKDALVSVRVAAARGRLHSYRLMTSLRSIHKEVHGGGRD